MTSRNPTVRVRSSDDCDVANGAHHATTRETAPLTAFRDRLAAWASLADASVAARCGAPLAWPRRIVAGGRGGGDGRASVPLPGQSAYLWLRWAGVS